MKAMARLSLAMRAEDERAELGGPPGRAEQQQQGSAVAVVVAAQLQQGWQQRE